MYVREKVTGERKAKFAYESIAETAIGIVTAVWAGETLDALGDDDGWRYRVAFTDEEVVLRVLNQAQCTREEAYNAFRGAPPVIQANLDVARIAVGKHGGVSNLQTRHNLIQEHFCRQIAFHASQALEFVPEELKKNVDLVKIAVQQNGYALRFAFGRNSDQFDVKRKAGGADDGVNLKANESVRAERAKNRCFCTFF